VIWITAYSQNIKTQKVVWRTGKVWGNIVQVLSSE
jgi:hypothetical protein